MSERTRILVVGVDSADAHTAHYEVLFRTWGDYFPATASILADGPASKEASSPTKEYVALTDVQVVVFLFDCGEPAAPTMDFAYALRGMNIERASDLLKRELCLVLVGAVPNFLSTIGIEGDWKSTHGTRMAPTSSGGRIARFIEEAREYKCEVGHLAWSERLRTTSPRASVVRYWQLDRIDLAESLHGILVAAFFSVISSTARDWRTDVKRHGSIYFLPPSRVGATATSWILLEDLLGVRRESEPPPWLEALTVPGQEEIDADLANVDAQISELEHRKADLSLTRKQAREPLRLLYESQKALEPVVWDALETLGASVERPPKNAKDEDGWFSFRLGDEVRRFVLEIKSTKKIHLDLKPLRQAADWREKSNDDRGFEHKAVVVGTGSVEVVPSEREDAFNDPFRRAAKRMRLAVVSCEDLFKGLVKHASGELDVAAFFSRIWETEGVVDFGGIL